MALDLKVIGAGLGRTGTTSLREALTALLGGPCFHMLEYKSRPELMSPWLAFVREHPVGPSPREYAAIPVSRWESLMPGYVACVDEPASLYWKPLAAAFPDALVILSLRDTDSWWASSRGIMDRIEEESKKPESLSAGRRAFLEFVDGIYARFPKEMSEEAEKAYFEAHNRRVLEFAKRDEHFGRRLLVWRVEDGWEPVCAALDLPVPGTPFPHRNKLAEYHGY